MHHQKHFFNHFLKRPQFQPDQDSWLPVQVYGLTNLQHHDMVATTFLKGR